MALASSGASGPARPLAAPAAHRVRRTFAFVDLSGFTNLGNSAGDDVAVAELSTFRAIVRAVGSATGIRVAKWLGDGAMLVGLEPVSLLSAVLEIFRRCEEQALSLPLHAGAVEGDVILFEGDDHVGVAVNLAARLADAAGPGQLFAPVSTLPGVERTEAVIGPIELPGFTEPVDVADLALIPELVESLDL